MDREALQSRLVRGQIGFWKAEWLIQKQRDQIAYLQCQGRDSSRARRCLGMLIERRRWYEREVERVREKLAQ
jgi:hypothetical protein